MLNKKPATTFVLIDEMETDHGGIGGESVTKLRQAAAAARKG